VYVCVCVYVCMLCVCSAHNKCNLNTCSAKRAVGLHERPLLLDVNKKGKTEVRCRGGGGEKRERDGDR
jgi:hypothetical protein